MFEGGPWYLTPLDSIDFPFVPVAKLPCTFGKHKGRKDLHKGNAKLKSSLSD